MSKWNKAFFIVVVLHLLMVSVSFGQDQPDAVGPAESSSAEDTEVAIATDGESVSEPQAQQKPSNIISRFIFLVLLAAAIGAGVWTAKRKQTSGIAGWLLLPAINLIISPLVMLVGIVSWIGALSKVTPDKTNIVYYAILTNAFLLGLTLYVAVLFFRKKQNAPNMYILLLAASIVLSIFMVTQNEYFIKNVFLAVVHACIWIPYFRMSKRVKATFGSGDQIKIPDLPKL